MTKVVTPSAKPVSREQAGKLCDKLIPRLQKSGIKSEPFQKVLKDKVHADKLGDEIVALVRRHVDIVGDTVRLDRSVRAAYPDWMEKVMHPELETTGPTEFDLADIEQWLHDGQKGGNWVKGERIYEHLKSNNMLESCLGLADLQAIQKLGIEVFRKHFAGKAVFGWRSVVLRRRGLLFVPCLFEVGGEVKLFWFWLDYVWSVDGPALRFRK